MFRKMVTILCLAALAGCTSYPIDADKTSRIDPAQVLDPALLEEGPGKGTVRIARDGGFWGGADYVLLYIDGRQVASVDSNRVAVLHVPSGPQLFGAQPVNTTFPVTRLRLMVEEGKTIDVRIGFDSSKNLIFERKD